MSFTARFLYTLSSTHLCREFVESRSKDKQDISVREGWLIDGDDCWIWRYWRGEQGLVRVFKFCMEMSAQIVGYSFDRMSQWEVFIATDSNNCDTSIQYVQEHYFHC